MFQADPKASAGFISPTNTSMGVTVKILSNENGRLRSAWAGDKTKWTLPEETKQSQGYLWLQQRSIKQLQPEYATKEPSKLGEPNRR